MPAKTTVAINRHGTPAKVRAILHHNNNQVILLVTCREKYQFTVTVYSTVVM